MSQALKEPPSASGFSGGSGISQEPAKSLSSVFDKALSWLIGGKSEIASHLLLTPAGFWLVFFLVCPIVSLLSLSVTFNGFHHGLIGAVSGSEFHRAFEPRYLPILLRTVGFALGTTSLCLIFGFPIAYYLSFRAGANKEMLMVFLMLPFWSSCLVVLYSWMILLGRDGLINGLLMRLHLLDQPLVILNSPFAVMLGLVYFYLPFMILPLYSSLEKIPRSYIEAAADLGAGPVKTFTHVTWPLSLPGVFAGCLLTTIPCLGDFLTAEFLGGPRTYMIGNLVEDQFLAAHDWPFGAALTVLLLVFLCSGVYFYQRLEMQEIERL